MGVLEQKLGPVDCSQEAGRLTYLLTDRLTYRWTYISTGISPVNTGNIMMVFWVKDLTFGFGHHCQEDILSAWIIIEYWEMCYPLNIAFCTISQVGVFFSNLNSCANPIVYFCLMPLYRRSIISTFCCKTYEVKNKTSTAENGNTHHGTDANTLASSKSSLPTVSSTVEMKT